MHHAFFNRADMERAVELAQAAIDMPNNEATLYSAHRIMGLVALLRDNEPEAALDHFRMEHAASLVSPVWYQRHLGGFLVEFNLAITGRPVLGIGEEMLRRGNERGWASGIAMGHYLMGRSMERDDPAAAIASYRAAEAAAAAVDNDNIWCWAVRERAVIELVDDLADDSPARLLEVLRRQIRTGAGADSLHTLCCLAIATNRRGEQRVGAIVLGHVDGRQRVLGASEQAFEQTLVEIRRATGEDWVSLASQGARMALRQVAETVEAVLEGIDR